MCAFLSFYLLHRFEVSEYMMNKNKNNNTHTHEWRCIQVQSEQKNILAMNTGISLLPSFLLNIKVIIIYNFVVEMTFIRSICRIYSTETITKKKMGSFFAHLHAVCQYLQCILCMCASFLFLVFLFVCCENGLWFHYSNVSSFHSHSTIFIYIYMIWYGRFLLILWMVFGTLCVGHGAQPGKCAHKVHEVAVCC